MKMPLKTVLAATAALAVSSVLSHAAPIVIVNGDMTAGIGTLWNGIAGWNAVAPDSNNYFWGNTTPPGISGPGTGPANFTPASPTDTGDNMGIGYLYTTATAGAAVYARQTLDGNGDRPLLNIAANTTYTLSVQVANLRAYQPAGLGFSLFATGNGAVLPVSSSSLPTINSDGVNWQIVYQTGSDVSGFTGPLAIQFSMTGNGTADNLTAWKNVTLDVIPEPSTVGLLALGSLGTVLLLRRRKRD